MLFVARIVVIALMLLTPAFADDQPASPQTPAPQAQPQPPQPDFATWLAAFRAEAIAAGIEPEIFDRTFKDIAPDPKVIALDHRQLEGKLKFARYLARLANPLRRKSIRQHLADNRLLLDEIGKRFGVPPRFIVALWCIESNFGDAPGNYPVIASLATLAFDGRRAALFKHELIAALRIVQEDKIEPGEMRGSWAGAMGQNQFMPSTYLDHAVSYQGDGRPDIWTREADVFASIANYLAKLGWHASENWGRMVKAPADLSTELIGLGVTKTVKEWRALGVRRADGGALPASDLEASLLMPDGETGPALLVHDNFRAILKWNNSTAFAAAVGLLADSGESH